MDDQPERAARMDMLRRLNPVELIVLRERCRGMTSAEIAAALDITEETAQLHLGNIYDKLDITFRREGTSMGRLMAFCPLLGEPDAPVIPRLAEVDRDVGPPPQHPSDQALALVRSDDAALIAQRGIDGAPPANNRNWLYGIAALLALVLIVALALFLFLDDDDDDDGELSAEDATATALAAVADEPPTETPVEEEPPTETPTPEPEDTPTPEPTATEEPTPTLEEATPTPEPTETPAATEPDGEPTPTETPADEPTGTPTATPASEPPGPTPQPGDEVFAADWSGGAGEWELGEGWNVENGMLTAEGPAIPPIIAPFEPDAADYAIEAEIMIDSLENCDDFLVGPFSRVTMVTQDGTEFPAGYIGGVCEGEWRIEAIDEEQNERDEIASGDLEVDVEGDPHTYRLEIVADEIRFFIDDEPVGEATDDRYAEPGQPGIYVAGDILIEIESFVVEELQPE